MSLSLYRFPGTAGRLWVLGQMLAARPALAALARREGLAFWKLMGSGTGEGFTPVPNLSVFAILAAWRSEALARRGQAAPPFRRWREMAAESWTLFLAPVSVRGHWSGRPPFVPGAAPPGPGPLAVLTRATLRLRALPGFWGRVPAISRVIGQDPAVLFKIGLGEVPWLHQVTFSLWPDAAAMAAFARGDGPHGRAIRAVRENGWFAEELYARFRVTGEAGHWAEAPRWNAARAAAEAAPAPLHEGAGIPA